MESIKQGIKESIERNVEELEVVKLDLFENAAKLLFFNLGANIINQEDFLVLAAMKNRFH